MSQRAHWCMTLPSKVVTTWSNDAKERFFLLVGNRAGQEVQFNNFTYKFVVGNLEGADNNTQEEHYHCLFSCSPGKTCTKTRVLESLLSVGYSIGSPLYLQPLDTTVSRYMDYMFKACKNSKNSYDEIINNAMGELRKNGTPTKEALILHLVNAHGINWYTKNKGMVDNYCSIPELFAPEKIVTCDEDSDGNVARCKELIRSYVVMFKKNIETSGFYTKHKAFALVDNDTCARYMTVVSLLPNLFRRVECRMDNIPALYLWGDSGSGKSTLFTQGKAYRMLATDSSGICKFKLDGSQTAFLFDDINADVLKDVQFSSTLRQLCLGSFSRIKVHSDTKNVKGWVVMTSNEEPLFIGDSEMSPEHKAAWARRFLCLKFNSDHVADFDLNGTEFTDHKSIRYMAEFVSDTCDLISVRNTALYETLKVYHSNCFKYLLNGPELGKRKSNELHEVETEGGGDVDAKRRRIHGEAAASYGAGEENRGKPSSSRTKRSEPEGRIDECSDGISDSDIFNAVEALEVDLHEAPTQVLQ